MIALKPRKYDGSFRRFITLLILTFIFFSIATYFIYSLHTRHTYRSTIEEHSYLIETPGCRISDYKAKSVTAMQHVSRMKTIVCGNPPLVDSNDTHLQVDHSALLAYGIEDTRNVSCCYRPMWRHTPDINIKPGDTDAREIYDGKIYDNDIRYGNTCVPFDVTVEINDEFVQIECEAKGKKIYKDYHAFVPTLKPVQSYIEPREDVRSVNVIIIGMDSLSRLNLIRQMPKTYYYLSKVLGALPMYGYNKVGLNTFPNLIPLLSGYSTDELTFCYKTNSAKFDLCPFIWRAYNSRGYATVYVEGKPSLGLFDYLARGFTHQPTQYNPRPIFYVGETEARKKGEATAAYCIGPRMQVQMVTEYTYKVLRRLRHFGQKHFVFSWSTSASHELIDEPQMADNFYYNLLRKIHSEGMLNDSIMIFASDHGLRFGPYLKTSQGHLENLLPAMFMVIPRWFQEQYPEAINNLRSNQKRLVTAYDLHQTLNDLLDMRSLQPESLNQRELILKARNAKDLRGISLFLLIPLDRNCRSAGVPTEYCACHQLDTISTETPIVSKVVVLAMEKINAKLHGFPNCLPLVLKEIVSASTENLSRVEGSRLYQVAFSTEPSKALFLASALHFYQSDTLELIGKISRLNAYRNESYCVLNSNLRPLCFCKQQGNDMHVSN